MEKIREDLQQEVIAALRRLAPTGFRCEVCTSQNWAVQKGFYWFSEHYQSATVKGHGPELPSVAVVCQTCGNSKFLNTRVLIPSFP